MLPRQPEALAASQHLKGVPPSDRRRRGVASHHYLINHHRGNARLLVHLDFTVSLARCRSCRNYKQAFAASFSTFCQGKKWSAAALAWYLWLPHSTLSKAALLSVYAGTMLVLDGSLAAVTTRRTPFACLYAVRSVSVRPCSKPLVASLCQPTMYRNVPTRSRVAAGEIAFRGRGAFGDSGE